MYVNLLDNLSVDIGIAPNFSFQPLPELGIEEPVICFWEDEQVSFIISLDQQPALKNHEAHWALLTESLNKEFSELNVTEAGDYAAENNLPISYKVFDAGSEASPMMYHLVTFDNKGKQQALWLVGSLLFCTDASAVNDIMISLLETLKAEA